MSKYILHFPEEIKLLEDHNQWLDAVTLLYDQWKKKPTDEHNLVCVVMEAWYAMLELEYLETKYLALENMGYAPGNTFAPKIESQKIYDILCYVAKIGFELFHDSVMFNTYVGYAASLTPLNFEDFIDISTWENTGTVMIHKAFLQDNSDRLTRLFYYASIDHNCEEYKSSSQEFWTTVSILDWGNSAVQRYFFDMFDGKKYQGRA